MVPIILPTFGPTATTILEKRYLTRNETGACIETPVELFRRVARAVAEGDRPASYLCVDHNAIVVAAANQFYDLMASKKFMPNTPTLMHAGKDRGCLSACFVLPIEDHIEGIFGTLRDSALVQREGGGTGFSFSRLRPKGDVVRSTMGLSSGPISFMGAFNKITDVIKQGSSRRGANMAMLRCLAGDTLIHTLHGLVPIRDLVGQRPYVYACDPKTKQVHVVQADKVFVSDTNRKLVRVWFDNDRYIDCTPDHLFMVRNGAFIPAEELQVGQSLMAFEKRLNKHGTAKRFVRTIACTGGRAEYEHRIVARDILKEEVSADWHVHHQDEDALNNDPGNLKMTNRSEHASEHVANLKELQEQIADQRRGRTLEETYGPEKAAEWKQRMSAAAKRRASNHKVARIEQLGVAPEVYDLSLPTLHNFAANEVFVHNCDHPDIREFIACKDKDGELANFNISVAITTAFQKAVADDETYDLINPSTGAVVRTERAREIWRLIAEHAWKTGEPGLWFIDRANEMDPLGDKMESTNPCGEQNLPPYGSCNLGSINLMAHYTEQHEGAGLDWDALGDTIDLATRFLDNVITINRYPLPQITAEALRTRRIGLGLMGWADLLIALHIPYDSTMARVLADKVMAFITTRSIEASEQLAAERGAFPAYDGLTMGFAPRRNGVTTTVAPTGTISIVCECSGGIEPLFALSFWRNQADERMLEVNQAFVAALRDLDKMDIDKVLRDVAAHHGSCQHRTDLPEELRARFRVAHDIGYADHVRMQAAFQRHVHTSISKTINMPGTATVEDVLAAYDLAWETGCKGVTVYRDGAREGQVFSTEQPGTPPAENDRSLSTLQALNDLTVPPYIHDMLGDIRDLGKTELKVIPMTYGSGPVTATPTKARHRPQVLPGTTFQWQVGDEKVFIIVNSDEVGVREVFINAGKCGSDVFSLCEALGMLVSGMLKEGMGTGLIKQKLKGIKATTTMNRGGFIHSIPDAVAQSIAMVEAGVTTLDELNHPKTIGIDPGQGDYGVESLWEKGEIRVERVLPRVANPCPKCDAPLQPMEGCLTCASCGYSKCS